MKTKEHVGMSSVLTGLTAIYELFISLLHVFNTVLVMKALESCVPV